MVLTMYAKVIMLPRESHISFRLTWQQALPYVLIIASIIGLMASFVLTNDKLHLLQTPTFQPSCNLNPIISCGAVMKSAQASTLGTPNSIFGLIAFSSLGMFGLMLLADASFKRWLWVSAQLFATAGVIGMHYLFFEDIFRIHAICPWCFSVWMVTIPAFFGITICNIRANRIGADRFQLTKRAAELINKYSTDLLVLWYLVIFSILLTKFWYYWKTLL